MGYPRLTAELEFDMKLAFVSRKAAFISWKRVFSQRHKESELMGVFEKKRGLRLVIQAGSFADFFASRRLANSNAASRQVCLFLARSSRAAWSFFCTSDPAVELVLQAVFRYHVSYLSPHGGRFL